MTVLWNHNEINVERIRADQKFLDPLIQVAKTFFCRVLMPELVARWYSRNKENHAVVSTLSIFSQAGQCTSNGISHPRCNRPPAGAQSVAMSLVNTFQQAGQLTKKITSCADH